MHISTEHIRQLRNQYAFDRDRSQTAPDTVRRRIDEMISILNELIQFREEQESDGLAEVLRLPSETE